ncbi:MAG: DeoR family transcriptional regulator, partial [Clostridia bacterium]|nr:DeoR family transcriptional regulator [Clostridia bacterium]
MRGIDTMRRSVAFVEERRSQIVDILKAEKAVSVAQISEAMQVSEITVRRDLDELVKKNIVVRFRGGAKINETASELSPHFSEKKQANMRKKERIAQEAAKRIGDNDIVFMNSGST